jgi:hypothetical protein
MGAENVNASLGTFSASRFLPGLDQLTVGAATVLDLGADRRFAFVA